MFVALYDPSIQYEFQNVNSNYLIVLIFTKHSKTNRPNKQSFKIFSINTLIFQLFAFIKKIKTFEFFNSIYNCTAYLTNLIVSL